MLVVDQCIFIFPSVLSFGPSPLHTCHFFTALLRMFQWFKKKKLQEANFFLSAISDLLSICDQEPTALAHTCHRPLIVMILITAQYSLSCLHGHLILSVSLPPDSKGTGGSKVQRPIYSCCSDRAIRSNYHTHKVALSSVQVIPIQPEQRSRLLFHSFLWSRATVWYAEDAPLTVIAYNYLRLTWRKIRGAPQVQMTGWFANDPVRHSSYEQSFPLSFFHHIPTRSFTFYSTPTD